MQLIALHKETTAGLLQVSTANPAWHHLENSKHEVCNVTDATQYQREHPFSLQGG